MDRIEPDSHHPAEPGQITRFAIPGYSPATDLRIARVAPGLSITLSHFEEPQDRISTLQRQKETVLLVFGLRGKAGLKIDGHEGWLTIAQGRSWLIKPGRAALYRQLYADCPTSFFVVTLTPAELTPPLSQIVQRNLEVASTAIELPDGRENLTFIADLFAPMTHHGQMLKVQAKCLQVIGGVLELLDQDTGRFEDRVRAYLTEHLTDQITLAELSQRFGMSHTSLNKRLREECGKTVFEYLRELRIARAVDLLRTSKLSIAQIAHESGFSSASHLSSTIRRATGRTASACRV